MKKFSYRAKKTDGGKIEGQYDANTKEEVVGMITSNGYYPLKVQEITPKPFSEISFNQRVTAKDLSLFCRQMYTMLDAGVTITSSLNMLSNQIVNKKLRTILGEIEEDVKKGEMLSESMNKYPNEFPKLLLSMVQSGEATGNIDAIMLRMSIHFEKENRINNKIKSAMIYPTVLSIVAVIAVIAIMTLVMPTFITLFEGQGVPLPLVTRIVIGISKFMKSYIIFIIIAIVAIVVSFNYYKKTKSGIMNISKFKLIFPVIASLTKKIIVSRFTRTMSTLLSSGISLIEAIPIVSEIIGNSVAEEELIKVRERVMRGEGLSGPIRESSVFPELLSSMIKIGEESGSLDDILNKTADFYDEEVDQAITAATALMEPALIVIMGLAIGTIVMAIMLPMFDMYSLI